LELQFKIKIKTYKNNDFKNKIKLNKFKKLNHSVMHHNRISATAAHEDSDPENSH